MNLLESKRVGLQAGQLWKIEYGYLQIVELGNWIIHYRMLREPDQRTAPTRPIALEALINFLRQSEAELVVN